MIKSKIPNWEISGWLTDICLLSFKEACNARQEANEEIEKQKSRPIQESRREETPQETNDEGIGVQAISSENEQKFEECVSCGNEENSCDCEVKTVNQIPF